MLLSLSRTCGQYPYTKHPARPLHAHHQTSQSAFQFIFMPALHPASHFSVFISCFFLGGHTREIRRARAMAPGAGRTGGSPGNNGFLAAENVRRAAERPANRERFEQQAHECRRSERLNLLEARFYNIIQRRSYRIDTRIGGSCYREPGEIADLDSPGEPMPEIMAVAQNRKPVELLSSRTHARAVDRPSFGRSGLCQDVRTNHRLIRPELWRLSKPELRSPALTFAGVDGRQKR